jgi:hypothetical protein
MLGDGESDLVRHLFLFNALFDLSLLALSALLLASVWRPIAALVLQSARQRQSNRSSNFHDRTHF